MVYSFITAFLFVALICAGIAMIVIGVFRKKSGKRARAIPVAIPACMVGVGLILLILIPGSFHTVDAGTLAVVKQMGVIVDVEGPGTYFDF